MIPEAYINEWSAVAHWHTVAMVEQDLVLSRAVVEIFAHPVLSKCLAFRGGTALHKLILPPASRYSEDIDMVQVEAGPIGPIFDACREVLAPFLGEPKRNQGPGVMAMIFRFQSETAPVQSLRLKVEINSREHLGSSGIERKPFMVSSRWFSGECSIPTYSLEELLGSKLRALYQRRKGRDLFDLWLGLTIGAARPELLAGHFKRYLAVSGLSVSAREYRLNMDSKIDHPAFVHDLDYLLRPDVRYDLREAYQLLDREVLSRL